MKHLYFDKGKRKEKKNLIELNHNTILHTSEINKKRMEKPFQHHFRM